MLKLNIELKQFEEIQESKLKNENLLERFDLQKAIINSWDLFKNEIGLPSAYLIGQEIRPHPSTQDAIDLLAYNPDDSSLIIIELKRDKNKLHLLQALSYAAMVHKWGVQDLLAQIQTDINTEQDELSDLINSSGELNEGVKLILISEQFDPEVIITSDWLSRVYSLDISAYSISLHKLGSEILIHLDQRYPLKELADVYESRGKRKDVLKTNIDIDWEDVIPKLKYTFARRGIELCKKIRTGDPSRRRFLNVRTNYDGFSWISINFREKYINVYLKSDSENSEEFLKSKLKDQIKVSRWRDGLSFLVETESQFEGMVQWLKLDSANNKH